MPAFAPSPALRRLLEKRLDTFEKLEIVLALRDADNRELKIEQLARELQIGSDVLRRIVTALVGTGLVEETGGDTVRLAANGSELPVLEEASKLYLEDRTQIVALFSSIALDRIRGMAARSFADAFKIGKKKGDDHG